MLEKPTFPTSPRYTDENNVHTPLAYCTISSPPTPQRPPHYISPCAHLPFHTGRTEFALAENTVDEGDGDLADGVPEGPRADHHLHLEDIPFRYSHGDNVS